MSKSPVTKKGRAAQPGPSKAPSELPGQAIPLERIDPSPLNRPYGKLDDLLASVAKHGVEQPIKLRPKGSRFEIVYGERRYAACVKLKTGTIPAAVEDLTDAEAHELRVIENACRHDPHPLEEAEAYETLLAMKSDRGTPLYTPEAIANLVGRSVQFIYGRLKLTALGPEMRKAFHAGELTATTAFLVARAIPRELQDEALLAFREHFGEGEGEPFPPDDVAFYIERNYLTRLDRAPFAKGDASLVPEAGACTSCPKVSGNQAALFETDTPKDICSDVICFRRKLAAHRERLAADVRAKGGTVLTAQQSNEIYKGSSQLPYNSRYVDVDSACHDDPKQRTWRELTGDLCPKLTLAIDPQGTPHALVLKTEALGALKEAGVDLAELRRAAVSPTDTAPRAVDPEDGDEPLDRGPTRRVGDPAEARAAAEVRRATISDILSAIVAAATARPAEDRAFAALILETMMHGGYHDAIADTVKRRALARPKGEAADTTLASHARTLDAPGLRALVLEVALARGAYFAHSTTYPARLLAAAGAYGVDIAAVEKGTAERLAAEREERAARKAKKNAA